MASLLHKKATLSRGARLDRALPTVAEVAYEVGFPNASHFTQLYSKRFGKKPSEY